RSKVFLTEMETRNDFPPEAGKAMEKVYKEA
ncbi:hypothetical protein AVEN_23501-1, partial [Araneus ventricosus]